MLQRRLVIPTGIFMGTILLAVVIRTHFFQLPKTQLRIFFSSELSGYVRPCG